MKKILSVLLITTSIFTAVFADNFFTNRLFEIKVNAPVNLSNNTFALADYFVQDLVIDLNELSKKMPNSGFALTVASNPSVEMNLRIPVFGGIKTGVTVGADVYGQFDISKTLFDFICNGNEELLTGDSKLDVTTKTRLDAFTYVEAKGAFKVGKMGFSFRPTYFIPVAHAYSDGIGVSVENDEKGNVKVDAYGKIDVYTLFDVANPSTMTQNIGSSAGFDIEGALSYDLSRFLELSTNFRIPLVPGHLNYHGVYSIHGHYETNFNSIINGTTSENNVDFGYDDEGWKTDKYAINRPMLLNVFADMELLPNLLMLRAGGGFGIRNPFTPEANAYPEYYVGGTVSLFNILSATVSTEYTNTLFIHQIAGTVNIRLIQLDLGVSTQSSSFARSFGLAGLGAFVNFTMGF